MSVAAIVTGSHLWGGPGLFKELRVWHAGDGKFIKPDDRKSTYADDLASNRFVDTPVVVYQADKAAETLFGLQVLPKLPDSPSRPKDYLVIVDTSASKAMGPLVVAQKITRELAGKIGPDDRMSIWVANINPKDLTRGFKSGKALEEALATLEKEVPLGAVNLKKAVTDGLASFEIKESRQRAILFLGDGKSIAEPMVASDRASLVATMVKNKVAFFAVPLGLRLDPQNLHTLITGTGGKIIRHDMGEKITDNVDEKTGKVIEAGLVSKIVKDIAEPILYNVEFSLPATFKDVLPGKLPPLRRDAGTLVVGKLPAGTTSIEYKLSGTVAGKSVRADASFKVPASDPEHFFLVSVFNQWKVAKDSPALLQSDRALAYAHKQNLLIVEDLLAKGELALEQNKLDVAHKLFEQAGQLAPHAARAKGGLALVEKMKTGKKSRADMLAELRLNAAKREVLRLKDGKRAIVVLADGDEKIDEPKGPDLLEDVKTRRAIAEQQANLMVAEAVRQANRLVRTGPDEAYELLKRTLDSVRSNDALVAPVVARLSAQLGREMESVARRGETFKRDQAQALALRAAADARLDLRRTATAAQDRVRERLRVFHNLMDQARELEANRQALSIRNDLVNQGLPVPPAVTLGYQQSLNGYHRREEVELRRVREDRWLATLLEVERSHIPFPDEPPVEFPSAAVIRKITRGQFDNWADFSKYRTGRYAIQSFGTDTPARLFELRDALNKTIDWQGIDDPKTTLGEALEQLSKMNRVTFDINERAFKYEMLNDVNKTEIANPNPLPGVKSTLGTVLKRILARVPVPSGATYLIRRDVIEITTGTFASAEKAIRVYPVADLVIPIPNAFNSQQVSQVGSIFGAFGQVGFAAGGGVALGQLGALGGFGGALGALGGQLGALGALGGLGGGALGALGGLGGGALGALGGLGGGALGALGGLGGGALGALGGLGGGALGALGGNAGGLQAGGFNFQGNQNLGQGGFAGFGGQQLGQLGNLGGQFGIQGGNQSQLLITLIRQVVGRPRDWLPSYNPITGQPLNPLDDDKGGEGELFRENNNLGYYPPSLALVVKAPSMIHTRASNLVITGPGGAAGGAGMVNLDGPGGRNVADARPGRNVDVANDGDERKDKAPKDPKKVWQDALAKGVTDPGLIIATADYLAMNLKFDHAAEFLKANLRQGVVVEPWVYKSLAIALRESGGSADEIERAEVSAADYEPLDSQGYLIAARALADDKNYERALAFCKQAAELEPGSPNVYADAARYADMAKDAKAMEWATSRLLRQDWPVRNDELQRSAVERLESLAKRLDRADSERLVRSVNAQRRRDLVVKLVWQGEADLDLKIEEPTGSFCTPLNKQTVGGGTMIADSLAHMTSETYVAAEGFSGDYKVWVERIWGKPLGSKAQLKIIRHQGTPNETEELITVKMHSNISEPLIVKLDGGRRTQAAYVPPPQVSEPLEDTATASIDSNDAVLNKLRALSDPEVTGVERGVRSQMASPGRPVTREAPMSFKASDKDRTVYQNRVRSFVSNSVDVTAQAVLSADRRSVRVSLSPVTTTATSSKPVQVISPVFPGASSDKP
jgi:tetratricopeptide (TPR) repeat protein